MMFRIVLAAIALFGLVPASRADSPAAPAEGAAPPRAALPAPDLDVSATITAVSDYRYRGVSLSNRDPAIQGQVTLTHKSGFYVNEWVSSIADNGGANVETQAAVGFARSLGATSLDAWAAYYLYPGAPRDNYAEAAVRLRRSFGPLELGAMAAYAPPQRHLGGRGNVYIGVDGSLPVKGTPLVLTASAGWEDGAFATGKRDWSVGIRAALAGFDCAISYVDAARTGGDPGARAAALISLSRTF